MTILKTDFGVAPDGQKVNKYTLQNFNGMEVDVLTYGGIISRWTAPNKNGLYENVVIGYDNLDQYLESTPYFGALIGRYGNRIDKGQFEIDGEVYQLDKNDGTNHLHGGNTGFDKVVWSASAHEEDNRAVLVLEYFSKDGDGGYPGNLAVKIVYTLTNNNELIVDYEAETDKKTIVNMTQHSYFNLSADFNNTILDHELMLNADKIVVVNEILIPTGELAEVRGTPFDFTTAKIIGEDIEVKDDQLVKGRGFDHCWVLNNQGSFGKAAELYHPLSGRNLEVYTSEPGIQFYSGNFLDGTLPIPGGGTYAPRTGLCLETQHYPDSPNQPDFPSVILEPGHKYQSRTTFRFSVKN